MIDPLIAEATRTTQVMIAREAPAPRLARQRKDAPMATPALHRPDSLAIRFSPGQFELSVVFKLPGKRLARSV